MCSIYVVLEKKLKCTKVVPRGHDSFVQNYTEVVPRGHVDTSHNGYLSFIESVFEQES